jgi:hypothetical protein
VLLLLWTDSARSSVLLHTGRKRFAPAPGKPTLIPHVAVRERPPSSGSICSPPLIQFQLLHKNRILLHTILMRLQRSSKRFPAILLAALLPRRYIGLADAFLRQNAPIGINQTIPQRPLLVTPLQLKRGGTKKKKDRGNTITVNKLAFRNYEVLEKWEAGISLLGTEVKR